MTDTKDFSKIDADLKAVLEATAADSLDREFGSKKTAAHEAALLWLLARGDPDALEAALHDQDFDSFSELVDAIQTRQFGGRFDAGFDAQALVDTPEEF